MTGKQRNYGERENIIMRLIHTGKLMSIIWTETSVGRLTQRRILPRYRFNCVKKYFQRTPKVACLLSPPCSKTISRRKLKVACFTWPPVSQDNVSAKADRWHLFEKWYCRSVSWPEWPQDVSWKDDSWCFSWQLEDPYEASDLSWRSN